MSKTVLVADDSVTMRKVFQLVFHHEDFALTVVENGADAVSQATAGHFDIVVLDCSMPGKNGYEACEAIRANPATAQVPVLLLGGTFEPFDEAKAKAVGATAHMMKPFESGAFLEKVKTMCGLPAGTTTPSVSYSTMASQAAKAAAASVASAPPATGTHPIPQAAAAPAPLPAAPRSMPGMPAGARPPPPPAAAMQGARPSMPPGANPTLPRPSQPPGAMAPRPGMPPPGAPHPGMARPGMPPGPGMPRPGMPMGGPPRPGMPMQGMPPGGPPRPGFPPGPGMAGPPPNLDALLRDALSRASREMIEKIAWEVVPQLAETIIRENLEKLSKGRG